jgi:hypothetical protein
MLKAGCIGCFSPMASVQQPCTGVAGLLRWGLSILPGKFIMRRRCSALQLVQVQLEGQTVHVMDRSNARKHLEPDQRRIGGEETHGQHRINGGGENAQCQRARMFLRPSVV